MPIHVITGGTTVYMIEVDVRGTKDQLREAAFSRTSIVGTHVGIAQWKPRLEVSQGEWRH